MKKQEGKAYDLNPEQKVLEVGTKTNETKVDDKVSFENFKTLYAGKIADKCLADFGTADDKDLLEDTAKEMYLASQELVPDEDTKSEGDLVEEKTKKEESASSKEDYALLDRLASDCRYFLNGNRAEKHLWAGNIDDQIAKMKELYNKLPEKPEWLSMEDIENFEKEMKSDKKEESKDNEVKFDYKVNKEWKTITKSGLMDMLDSDRKEARENQDDDAFEEADDALLRCSQNRCFGYKGIIYDPVEERLNESCELCTASYEDLDKELDNLISNNATDKQLNDFIEEIANNEVITNKEYNTLLNKAQDTRRIDETKATKTESRDAIAENLPKFIYDLGDEAWSYNGESKNANGQKLYIVNKNGKETLSHNEVTKKVLEKFPQLLVLLDAHNCLVFVNKKDLHKKDEAKTTKTALESIKNIVNSQLSNVLSAKTASIDDAVGIKLTRKSNQDLVTLFDMITKALQDNGISKKDYEIDLKGNDLVLAMKNMKLKEDKEPAKKDEVSYNDFLADMEEVERTINFIKQPKNPEAREILDEIKEFMNKLWMDKEQNTFGIKYEEAKQLLEDEDTELAKQYSDRVKNNITDKARENFETLKEILEDGEDKQEDNGYYFAGKALKILDTADREQNLNPYMNLTKSDILNMIEDSDTVEEVIDGMFEEYEPNSALTWSDNFVTILNKLNTNIEDGKEELDEVKEPTTIDQELLQYLFNEMTIDKDGEIDYLPDFEEVNSTYDDTISEEIYNNTANYLKELVSKASFYKDSNKLFIELSDNHTLWDINNDNVNENIYEDALSPYFSAFEEMTNTELYSAGRSGRHIVVDYTLENLENYDKLQKVQQELEREFIDEMNNYGKEEESKEVKTESKEDDVFAQIMSEEQESVEGYRDVIMELGLSKEDFIDMITTENEHKLMKDKNLTKEQEAEVYGKLYDSLV